eukprot:Phypoly_transcript_08570.p1 GENE.Phypoly_transcript_08570~~Phypoly_transcript_08570.p1  ORF type:complete len:389 (+),score=77.22 Phypoly_transcript_08570:133-1299(+)
MSSSEAMATDSDRIKVTLYNSDHTVNLSQVIKPLFEKTKFEFDVTERYFPAQQKQIAAELESQTDPGSIAVLAVHAHESRLSINEQRAGIGYRLIYQALLKHTQNRVLVVIAHDDRTQYKSKGPLLADWIRNAISYQFSTELLNGETGFVLSWNGSPMPIHRHALEHFCSQLSSERTPYHLDSYIEKEPIDPSPLSTPSPSTPSPSTSLSATSHPPPSPSSPSPQHPPAPTPPSSYLSPSHTQSSLSSPSPLHPSLPSTPSTIPPTLSTSPITNLPTSHPTNPPSHLPLLPSTPNHAQVPISYRPYYGRAEIRNGNIVQWNPPLLAGSIPNNLLQILKTRTTAGRAWVEVNYDGADSFAFTEEEERENIFGAIAGLLDVFSRRPFSKN